MTSARFLIPHSVFPFPHSPFSSVAKAADVKICGRAIPQFPNSQPSRFPKPFCRNIAMKGLLERLGKGITQSDAGDTPADLSSGCWHAGDED